MSEYEAASTVTMLLERMHAGDATARDALIANVYDELRSLARRFMRGERPGHTLTPTALVHEASLRLLQGQELRTAGDRGRFFRAAARAMRQVLIDHARARKAGKRGGGAGRMSLDDVIDAIARDNLALEQIADREALGAALEELARRDERQSEIVGLRFFCDMRVAEIAECLDVSVTTVDNELRSSRAWLRSRLTAGH